MKPINNPGPIVFNASQDERPYLGSPSVIEQLLRQLLSDVVQLRGRQLKGESIDYEGALNRLGQQFQDTLYGRNPGFAALPWNQPAELGRSLVRRASLGGDDGDAVLRLIARMVDAFADAYLSYEASDIGEPEFRAFLDKLVERYRDMLLGLPGA